MSDDSIKLLIKKIDFKNFTLIIEITFTYYLIII